MDKQREALIDRVAVLTTERDAEALREMARDLEELTAGVHCLAEQVLEALRSGNQRDAVRGLERLKVIE